MRKKRKNNKALGLFILLCIFSFFAVKITKKISNDNTPEKVQIESAEACTSCGGTTTTEEKIVEEDTTNYQVAYLDKSGTVDITNQLDGSELVQGVGSCSGVNYLPGIVTLCSKGTGSLNFEFGHEKSQEVYVSKNAKVELIYVTYPLAFWLGQYIYKDNRKEISDSSTEYRSNGEQIDESYQSKTLSPDEAVEFRGSISGTVRQKFEVEGSVSIAPITTVEETKAGSYVVSNKDESTRCACKEDVAVSDYNVGKTNYIASDKENGGYLRQQIPGGDHYDESSRLECLEEKIDYTVEEDGLLVSCNNILARVKGWFDKTFGFEQWNDCKGRTKCTGDEEPDEEGNIKCPFVDTEDCTNIENIGVQMTSIFGAPYKCEKELCANAFTTYAYKGTLSPEQASSKKVVSANPDESLMFYIGTPCKAKITDADGSSKNSMTVDVICLWDATQTLDAYKLQKKDQAPTESYPDTYQEYWQDVQVAIGASADYYGL